MSIGQQFSVFFLVAPHSHTSRAKFHHILSTAIAYLCVTVAKHVLNDPHSDKHAIMSSVLIPQGKALYNTDYTRYGYQLANIYRNSLEASKVRKKCKFSSYKKPFSDSILESKNISNDQELIQSDPTSCPKNQKGNNYIHKLTAVYKRHSR